MNRFKKKSGFTLIEVVVALAILGLVLGGAISTVNQYADQRGFINAKMIGSQVAWNVLVDEYRQSENWAVKSGHKRKSGNVRKDTEKQNGQDWTWELDIEPAVGKDMFRYEASVRLRGSDRNVSSLSLYIIQD